MSRDASPALSILLPTYNGGRFLAEQIDSILTQSFDDFELLLLDDGSTDDTRALNDDYARADRRVRVVPASGNQGQKARLLQLLHDARGGLISIADQDDVWDRERTRLLVEGLGDHAMSYGRSELTDGAGASLGRTLISCFGPEPLPGDRLTMLFRPRVSGHAMVARRETITDMAFLRYQPFDWLSALEAAFSRGLVYVEGAVVHHRIHGGNQSNGTVAGRPGLLQRLKPGPLYLRLQDTRVARATFVDSLEHLMHSPVLSLADRKELGRVALRCRGEWHMPGSGRPFSNPALRAMLLERLRPFAGSQTDWAVAVEHIELMTRAGVHPRSLRALGGRVLR